MQIIIHFILFKSIIAVFIIYVQRVKQSKSLEYLR